MLNELILRRWSLLVKDRHEAFVDPVKLLITFNSSTVLARGAKSAKFEVAVRMLY